MLYIENAFKQDNSPLWLYTYRILSTTKSTGLIQLIPDAISIDELKKSPDYAGSLRSHFEKTFGYEGGPEPPALRNAIEKYVQSMAAYSIVSYALAIKDRHNGNIMIDADGHIIHIDFGFILGIAPGKQFSMEKAPFKLTEEMANVMGGRFSADFVEYARLCTQAMKIIRKNVDAISLLMEIMQVNSNVPCFRYNKNAMKDFRNRMMLNIPEQDIEYEVNKLIRKSYRHSGTKFYDDFQLATNGILP
jgi:phosphatidylinositol 4-kinase